MKKFFTFIAAVLFWSVCIIVPTDDAPFKTYILWLVYSACTLGLARVIMRRIEDDEHGD